MLAREKSRDADKAAEGCAGGGNLIPPQVQAVDAAAATTRCLSIPAWAFLLCLSHKQCASGDTGSLSVKQSDRMAFSDWNRVPGYNFGPAHTDGL